MKCYDCEGEGVTWCCGIDSECETCGGTGEMPDPDEIEWGNPPAPGSRLGGDDYEV